MDFLPDHVLLRIFGYLSVEQLSHRIAPVSRRWNKLAKHPSLWTSIEFKNPYVDPDVILGIISRSTELRQLVFGKMRDEFDFIAKWHPSPLTDSAIGYVAE